MSEESLRQELEVLQKKLNDSQLESRQYLQNVAHQLTAPLGAIKWNIESLNDPKVAIKRKQMLLRSIYSQATILVHLIKNFSLMSNLEADHELGQFREQPEAVDIKRLCINLANDFQPQAYERNIKIEVDDTTFEKALKNNEALSINKNLVAQAISNIMENAVKYSESDATICISCFKIGNDVFIETESEGIPIDPKEVSKLTERKFRGTAAKNNIPAGTGIGLYLADKVMNLHDGRIQIKVAGRNTKVSLVFPDSRISKNG